VTAEDAATFDGVDEKMELDETEQAELLCFETVKTAG
jgi:hypothetical protein